MSKILIGATSLVLAIILGYFVSILIEHVLFLVQLKNLPSCDIYLRDNPYPPIGGKYPCVDTHGGLFLIFFPILLLIFYGIIWFSLRRFIK